MAPSATHTATDDEIIALEHAYWDAMRDSDIEAALELTYDPCIVAGAQGVATFDHAAMQKMSENKKWQLSDYTIDNMNVQTVSDDVSVLGYTINLTMDVEGKSMSSEFAETSTWVKQNGKWVCVQHSEAPLGDPFGRDKKAAKKKK